MATKQIRKTSPKPAQAGKTKTKAKAKASTNGRKESEAPDTKTKTTPRESAAASSKATTRRQSASAKEQEARGGGRKVVPAVKARPSRRRPGSEARQPEPNGHVSAYAEPLESSIPAGDPGAAADTRSGTLHKAARSQQAERIFLSLFEALDSHAQSQGIGLVAEDAQFDWGEPGNQELHPDLAFVSYGRWAAYRHVPRGLTWHVVPDLVVEIVRESAQTEPISAWLDRYFQAGVSRVWVVYPERLQIHDHDSPSSSRPLDRDQTLDGGSILPGFQMSLNALFGRQDG